MVRLPWTELRAGNVPIFKLDPLTAPKLIPAEENVHPSSSEDATGAI